MMTSSDFESAAGDSGAEGASGTEQQMKDKLSEVAQAAKEQASAAAEPLKEKARNTVEEQKERGATRMDQVAQAVHGAADEISKEMPQAAKYIHAGAGQLERASRTLRENNVDDLLQMANRWAHDRPVAFIGGSVAAGFVLARFLRSSAPDSSSHGASP